MHWQAEWTDVDRREMVLSSRVIAQTKDGAREPRRVRTTEVAQGAVQERRCAVMADMAQEGEEEDQGGVQTRTAVEDQDGAQRTATRTAMEVQEHGLTTRGRTTTLQDGAMMQATRALALLLRHHRDAVQGKSAKAERAASTATEAGALQQTAGHSPSKASHECSNSMDIVTLSCCSFLSRLHGASDLSVPDHLLTLPQPNKLSSRLALTPHTRLLTALSPYDMSFTASVREHWRKGRR